MSPAMRAFMVGVITSMGHGVRTDQESIKELLRGAEL